MSGSADFLLELLSEEIPARMQAAARGNLKLHFGKALAEAGIFGIETKEYSTPRRLVLIARGLPLETAAVSEELKGPKTAAPQQALDGFLRKTGLSQDQLQDRDGTWFAVIDKPGRATADVIAEAVAGIIRDFQWPKSMRWGAASASTASLRWVRPLHSIVALLGEQIVDVKIDGVTCGASTLGHRFHHPGPITIGGAHDYVEKLRACHVLVDQVERETIVRKGAIEAAENAGFLLVEDEGLVIENAGLTEWPVPLLGSFDPDYLDVPQEVIQLTARTNQKYFVMRNGEGALAPHFICTANIDAHDGGTAIVAGNERVLAARLSDARFFWQQDLKVPLEVHAKKLSRIIFHEKLGSLRAKTERVALLAEAFASKKDRKKFAKLALHVAQLTKADLTTGLVGEFPELQGVIGGYYAQHERMSHDIVSAIRDHYLPVGQSGTSPKGILTQIINLADRLDTIVCFFAIDEAPTGSKDPFALRRAAISFLRIIIDNSHRIDLVILIRLAINSLKRVALETAYNFIESGFDLTSADASDIDFSEDERAIIFHGQRFPLPDEIYLPIRLFKDIQAREEDITSAVFAFLVDRLKVQQREAGVRHDLIDAVFALGNEDDLVRLLARVNALQAFVETGEGGNLLAGYKRAANILKKETWDVAAASGADVLPDEAALAAALDTAGPTATAAVEAEDFTAAMSALASLRAPIDAFFEHVIVNDPDPGVRARRLGLLARFRDAVHAVADFSKIEG